MKRITVFLLWLSLSLLPFPVPGGGSAQAGPLINSYRFAEATDFNTPPITANLSANWDASDSTTLYDAVSGGSLVAADGSVARWEDKSGNGNHATQSISGRRPLRKLSVSGGRDGIRFNGATTPGAGTFLSHPLDETSNFSLYIVVKSNAGTRQIYGGKNSGAVTLAYMVSPDWGTFDSSATFRSAGVTGTGFNVLSMTRDAGIALFLNGTAGYSTGSFTPYPGDTNLRRSIGGYDNPTAEDTLDGDICQILVYSAAHNSTDRATIEAWLKSKWGIP